MWEVAGPQEAAGIASLLGPHHLAEVCVDVAWYYAVHTDALWC